MQDIGLYDEKTKVITPSGIKSISELFVGDKVFGMDNKTLEFQELPIIKIESGNFSGDFIHFSGSGKNLFLSEGNKVSYLLKKTNKLGTKVAKIAREMSHFTFPKAKYQGITPPLKISFKEDIPEKYFSKNGEIEEISSIDLFYLIGLYIGDGTCDIIKKENLCYSQELRLNMRNSKGQVMSNEEMEKTGVKKTLSVYKCPRISLYIPESDKSWARVKDCLNRIGVNWTRHGPVAIYFSSWGLFKWFDKCGHLSWEKRIPKEYLKYDNNHLMSLAQGMLDSDGHRNRCITTTSYGLVEDFLELCAKIGKNTYFVKRPWREAKLKCGRVIATKHQVYDLYFKHREIHYQKNINTEWYVGDRTAKIINHSGLCWNIDVGADKSILLEREGYTFYSSSL